jgi:hypothetical protein
MSSWDRRSASSNAKRRRRALRRQVVDVVAPFSPWWRGRLKALGRSAASVATPDGLASLPAVGERDVCPDGDPAGAAGLVLQAGEQGWALHAEGPRLRSALARRVFAPRSYQAIVEADTRPTSFVWSGLAVRFPLASTRSDLDVVARAGARLWEVLGLSRADVVVSALPLHATAERQALELGALGAGAPLLAAGLDVDDVAEALHLVPATVLALPVDVAADVIDDLASEDAPLGALRTLLVVGAPSDDERDAVREALDAARAPGSCAVLAVHVPSGHRLAWGECRQSGGTTGLHAYPDLEVLDVVDPETGERPAGRTGPHELVVNQLGLRGTALLRWRTADLVDVVTEQPCPSCGRTVPRVLGTQRAALVPELALAGGPQSVDLRAVAGALLGRADVADWRVEVAPSRRRDVDRLLVHVVPSPDADPAGVAVELAGVIEDVAGVAPTQVVVADSGALPSGAGVTPRLLLGG